jgi:hypothetical protein
MAVPRQSWSFETSPVKLDASNHQKLTCSNLQQPTVTGCCEVAVRPPEFAGVKATRTSATN